MKNKISLYAIIMCSLGTSSAISPINSHNPHNTIIVFDLDDTLLEQKQGGVIPGNANLQWAIKGVQFPYAQKYIPARLDQLWNSITFKKDAINLLKKLQQNGYQIWFATNKDRASYDDTVCSLDTRYTISDDFIFSSIPQHIFLAQPTKQYLNRWIPADRIIDPQFATLVDHLKNTPPSDTIHYIPEGKPHRFFFDAMIKQAHNKQLIFFDDNGHNVEAANNHSSNQIKAFATKEIADIENNLHKLGIMQ